MVNDERKHLLIVDDEAGSRTSLEAVFRSSHRVSVAANADEASNILGHQHVDIMLLDLMMPNTDGLEFLKSIRRNHPKLPVVMISASLAVRPVVEAIRGGAHDFITKPYEVNTLRHVVEEAEQQSSRANQVKLADAVSSYEKELIQEALMKTEGIQTRAAKLLGTTRRILRYRMEKLNIPNSYGHKQSV